MRSAACLSLGFNTLFLLAGCGMSPTDQKADQSAADNGSPTTAAIEAAPAMDREGLIKLQGLGATGEWKIVSADRNGLNFKVTLFDKRSIIKLPNLVRQVWRADISADKGEMSGYSLSQEEYDCGLRTWRTITSTYRREDGSSPLPATSKSAASAVLPGTVGEEHLRLACDDSLLAKAVSVPQAVDPIRFIRRLSLGVRTESDDLSEADFEKLLNELLRGRPYLLKASEMLETMRGWKTATGTGKPGSIDTDSDRKAIARLIRAHVSGRETRKAMLAFIS